MCMMAVGLLRWCSLTCYRAIGSISNSIGYGWHFCSLLFLLNYPQCMDQLIFWSFYAHFTFSQFVHRVSSCDGEWWPCLVSFHVMEQIHDFNDQHMGLKLGPNWVWSQVSLPSDPFQGVNWRVSGFTVSEVSAVDTMFSVLLLWQWDFQGSAMPCPSKALEYSLFSDSQKPSQTTT